MNKQQRKQIVIAGGGITGLSAAYYLEQLCKTHNVDADIVVVEKSSRFGGHVHTGRKNGFVIERGPDSFLARKTSILELMQELGMGNEVVGTRPEASHSYIAYRNRLHPIPDGFMLGVPTKWKPFITTRLLSLRGKMRASLDLVLPRRSDMGDESLGGLLRRRLGNEVLEQIAEPLLAGIYAGNADSLSVKATFPMLQETEQKHRSLIVGMLGVKKSRMSMSKPKASGAVATSKTTTKAVAVPQASQEQTGAEATMKPSASQEQAAANTAKAQQAPKAPKSSMFLSAKGGLEGIVERLEAALADNASLMKNTEISGIVREGELYAVQLTDGSSLYADAMIIATPAHVAARLIPNERISIVLSSIPYASVMNVVLAYREQDAGISLQASGFVVPRKEERTVTACTWTSSKWAHTAPQDHILLRAYVGKYGRNDANALSDDELITQVRDELKDMMGISATPIFTEVNRLPHSMPQYQVGHLDRMDELEVQLAEAMPGIYLGGGGYRGIGVPDCISQGKDMANKLLKGLLASQL
ncbi:protoporphyrinogen oxidase [Paenibacillus sp. CAU 1782]